MFSVDVIMSSGLKLCSLS